MIRTLLLAPVLFTASVAAQCEIARPGSELQNFWYGNSSFAPGVVALAGNSNEVAIYEPGPLGWTNTTTLAAPGFYLFENPTVFTDGKRLLIGMTEDGDSLTAEGRVYVYEKQNGAWQPAPALVKANSATGLDTFGSGMTIHENVMVVGASMTVQDVLCGPGKSLIYEYDGTDWVEVAEFHPHDQTGSMGGYGFAMDTDGQTAVLGAHFDDELAKFGGAVYVYARDPVSGWSEEVKLAADNPAMQEFFGTAVVVEGDQLYVGAPGLGTGAVYVYERQPSGWQRVQTLTASNGVNGDGFGAAISIDGARMVIGASEVDYAGTLNVGAIYSFERVNGQWIEVSNVVATDAGIYQRFGAEVSLVGNQVLWGAVNASGTTVMTRLHSLGIERKTNYCTTTTNSSGKPATADATGCDSLIANDLTISFSDAPPGMPAALLFSQSTSQIPFGNGLLCVAAPKVLAYGSVDGAGTFAAQLDFLSPSLAQLSAGDTPLFQGFFRDIGFGAGFGTSNGLAVSLND